MRELKLFVRHIFDHCCFETISCIISGLAYDRENGVSILTEVGAMLISIVGAREW